LDKVIHKKLKKIRRFVSINTIFINFAELNLISNLKSKQMKKTLLLTISLLAVISLSAQRYQMKGDIRPEFRPERNFNEALINNTSFVNAFNVPEKPVVDAGNRDIVTIIPIGGAGNAYGLYNGGRTALWADNNLNTVAFVHRMLIPPGSGYLAYDLSTDGGMTFTNNIQVYDPTRGDNARYPQGVIYNPTGNTVPDNAYFSYFAPTLDGSNAGSGSWGGYAGGVHKLNQGSNPTQHDWSSRPPFRQNVPSAMTINPVNGDIWVYEPALIDGLGNQYTDSLLFTKGVFNSASQDYSYDRWLEYLPAFEPGNAPADEKIAFAPNGQIGYMSLLADNGGDPFAAGYAYYPVIYKTVDGGQTWTGPTAIVLSGPDGFEEVKYYLTDEQWNNLWVNPELVHRDSALYTTAFTHDMVVDKNGDIHIAVTIGVSGGADNPYSIIASGGYGATFHIYSVSQGACFAAQFVTHNNTFRGEWGDISEDSRSQASTTQDGSKVFLSWADTDFEGVTDNIMPDIWCWGFDVTTRMYTGVENVTYLSEGWLEAYQGTASHYVFSNGGTYTIPFVYQSFTGGDPDQPVEFKYVQDFTFTDADFTNGPHVPPTCGTPGDANGDGAVNVLDVVAIINHIMGFNPTPFIFENADVNGDGIINVLDAVETVNIVLGGKGEPKGTYGSNIMRINDVTAEPGSNIIVEMEIINEDQFVAWQFDIPMPEGFDYVANSAALTSRAAGHQINAVILPNTTIFRSLAFSFTNAYFLGNEGVIATYEFITPNTAGTFEFVLVDAIIASLQAQDIISGTENGTITLGGATPDEYTVTFNVADQNGAPITDAVVTLGTVTNPAGQYVFTVEPGTYAYTVVKAGYSTGAGNVTVVDQDVLVDVTLIAEVTPEYTVTFNVADQDGAPITNAVVTLGAVANPAGQYVFTVEPGTYAYTVVKAGYSTGTGNVTVVDQDVLVDVTLNEVVLSGNIMKLHDVVAEPGSIIVLEMEVINEDQFVAWQFDIPLPEGFDYVANSAALTDRATNHQIHANVLPNTNLFRSLSISFTNDFFLGNSGVVATLEFTTPDVAGVYDFVLEDAIISSIQAQNILTGTENATVTLEGAIEEYTVTFIITDQYENEIYDAVVTLGDVTNAAGDYIFTVEPGTYSFSIEKIGFLLETGDVTVIDQDVTVTVIMIVDGINELQNNFTITSIYPNPAKNYTSFKLTLNKRSNLVIDITNILGQKVQTVNSGTFDAGEQNIKINTESLRSGMYFLTIKTDNYKTTSKFIVE